ncbi:MAG: DUF4956 domain-containing protein [Planctomycetia bacterium]|nr:DUF4956 domain-containing protein [Planctomycetia bacterium]
MLDWLFQAVAEPGALPKETVLLRLLYAFLLGVMVALIHRFSAYLGERTPDRPFMTTLVLLSVLIGLVTVVIGDNVARAFSLVGSLAIVRFRTVVEDTRDTTFVIFAVVSGMSAASGYLIAPLFCAPLVLATVFVLHLLRTPSNQTEGTLYLRFSIALLNSPRIEALLQQYLRSHRLTGMATARGGSAYDLSYRIRSSGPQQIFLLVDELSRIDGVQSVELKDG